MKKLLCAMLCLSMAFGLSGCGNDTSKEETSLEKVSKSLTVTTEETKYGSQLVRAADKNDNSFLYYASIEGGDKAFSDLVGLQAKDMVFVTKGNAGDVSYYIKGEKLIIGDETVSIDSMKEKMESVLKETGLTLDEIEEACAEKAKG